MRTNKASKQNPALKAFEPFIGEWDVQGSHPYVPDTTLHGHHTFKKLEGGAFVVMRTHIDDPRFPDGIAIFGSDDTTGELFMLYFDERDISRKHDVSVEGRVLAWKRDTPAFSQRFTLEASADGNGLVGKGRMKKENGEWEDDIQLTFSRVS
jgi:hypothetical protein